MNTPKTNHDYLGVRSLAAIIIVTSLLSGVAFLAADRVRIELGVWYYAIAFVGPLGCLFLVGMLLVAFFRTGKQNRLALGLGIAFGLAPFAILCYFTPP